MRKDGLFLFGFGLSVALSGFIAMRLYLDFLAGLAAKKKRRRLRRTARRKAALEAM
jgi:hypothetical protein